MSTRTDRAGRLIIRAGQRRKRRYLAWQSQRDYLTREYPATLVREASSLLDRLYAVFLGVER